MKRGITRRIQNRWKEKLREISHPVEIEVIKYFTGLAITAVGTVFLQLISSIHPLLTRTWSFKTINLISGSIFFILFGCGLFYALLRPKINKLAEAAATDELTGAYSSREFENRLQEEYDRAIRYNHTLSLVLIDIDSFKRINSQWGYNTGDAILQEFVQFLISNTRSSDQIFRYKFGDEFAILLPGTTGIGARSMIERLRSQFENYIFHNIEGTDKISFTFSAGIATQMDKNEPEDLRTRAEDSLQASKKGGEIR